ncbi:O-antigen ligase family protein [Candidatus Falkowbacteria bacterium]|nr:MAG: O-antigen ligase family protein [Candidatus Falkowbacteria bacterium]
MTYILLLILAVGFAGLAWKKLETAVQLLVLLLPLYLLRFTFVVPMTFLEVMILIVFVVWFLKNRFELVSHWKGLFKGKLPAEKNRYPFQWAIIAWLIISFIAVGVAGFSNAAFGIWRAYFFEPLLLFIVIINTHQTREKIICLLGSFSLSTVAVSVFAIYQYITGHYIPNDFWASSVNRRATSFFPFPNAVGLYLAPIIMLLVGNLGRLWKSGAKFITNEWQYLATIFGIMLGLGAVAAARSEGAIFALAIGFVLFGLFSQKKIRVLTLGLIIAGGLMITFIQPLQHYIVDRVLLRNFSGQVRQAQWKETWQMLSDGRLLSGAGLASYQSAIKPYHQEGIFVKDYRDPDYQRKVVFNEEFRNSVWQPLEIYLYPHNVVLNFWTELGLIGVLVFLWISITFLYYGVRAYRYTKKQNDPFMYVVLGLTLSLVVILIHGMVDVPYFKNDLAAMFWVMMGMMGVVSLNKESSK